VGAATANTEPPPSAAIAAPGGGQRRDRRERHEPEQCQVRQRRARAESHRGPSTSPPASAQTATTAANRRSAPWTANRLPNSSVSTSEPEWKDVRGERDTGGPRADEDQRRNHVVCGVPARREAPDREREDRARVERAGDRRAEQQHLGEAAESECVEEGREHAR
jgi:hypothetical protein